MMLLLDTLRRAGLLCLAPILAACSPAALLNATVATSDLTITRDVRYGPQPRQTLDLYRADSTPGPAPVVVFLYGGSWQSGSKADYLFAAAALARRGALVVVPDYRLYPQVKFPVFVQDAARAVAWTMAHANSYGGDPDSVTVMGHSAGAQIAALLAFDPHWLIEAGTSRDCLSAMIGLAGPYDFLPIRDPAIQAVFDVPDLYATQPINFADGHNPPTLLLVGRDDTTVDPGNTTRFAERIRDSGGPVAVKAYHDLGHVGVVLAMTPLFQGRAPVLDDITRFLQAHQQAE